MPLLLLIFSIVLGGTLTVFFSEYIRVIYIVMGQGHFILAYLYMYKAGKISVPKLSTYLLIFSVFIFVFIWVLDDSFLLLVTAVYFVIHFVLDSFFLNKVAIKFHQLPLFCLPYLWMGAIRLADYMFMTDLSSTLITLFPLSYLTLIFIKKRTGIYLLFYLFPLFIYLTLLFKIDLLFFHYLHILFLSHYIMWYFYIFYSKDKFFLRKFVVNLFAVHLILIFIGILYLKGSFNMGDYIFSDNYFYIWTLMHFVATFRLIDFKI